MVLSFLAATAGQGFGIQSVMPTTNVNFLPDPGPGTAKNAALLDDATQETSTEETAPGDPDSVDARGSAGLREGAAELAEKVALLGDSEWQNRERATQELLQQGPEVAPFLRRNLGTADPETRARLLWLLRILDPPRFRVALLRLQPVTSATPTRENAQPWATVREWLAGECTEREPFSEATDNLDGESQTFVINSGSSGDDVVLQIENSSRTNSTASSIDLAPGEFGILGYEDHVDEERALGQLQRALRSTVWLAWVLPEALPTAAAAGNLGAAAHWAQPDALLRGLGETLRTQLTHGSERGRKSAYQLAIFLDTSEPLPTRSKVLEENRAQWLIAAAATRPEALEEALRQHSLGSDEIDAAIALVRAGSLFGLQEVGRGIGEYPLWQQYLAVKALVHYLANFPCTPGELEQLLGSLLEPSTFAYLPWQMSVEPEILLHELQDRVASESFMEHLLPCLLQQLQSADADAYTRQIVAVRLFLRAFNRNDVSSEQWTEAARGMLGSRFFSAGFAILFRARCDGTSSEQSWAESLQVMRDELPQLEVGEFRRALSVLDSTLAIPGLELPLARQLWQLRLLAFASEDDSIRQSLDRKFNALFPGALPPNPSDWVERGQQWQRLIEEATEEQLVVQLPKDAKQLVLTEVDFRIDQDRQQVDTLAYSQRTLQVGVSYPNISVDGMDETIYLSPFPPNAALPSYRLGNRGRQLRLGEPELRSYHRTGSRLSSYLVTNRYYGRQGTGTQRSVSYTTLLLLQSVDDAITAPDWEQLSPLLIEFALQPGPHQQAWFGVLQMLRLKQAVPRLIELHDANATEETSLTLFVLGDDRGLPFLRSSITENNINRKLGLLQTLVREGDPQSVQRALDWVVDPPEILGERTSQIVSALEPVVWGAQPSVVLPAERSLEVLVAALEDRNNYSRVIQILRRKTGLDFGYYEAIREQDYRQRIAAQAKVAEKWQQWFAQRQQDTVESTPPKQPQPDVK